MTRHRRKNTKKPVLNTRSNSTTLQHDIPTLKAKTEKQKEYLKSLKEKLITISVGPAGTGKSCLAVYSAYIALIRGHVKKIIITRPTIEVQSISRQNRYGSLPGSLQEKIHPYLIPIYEEFGKFANRTEIAHLIESGTIEIVPLEFMRGRNFHDCFVICDEAQNLVKKELDCLITRIGDNTRIVLNGDTTQCDLPREFAGGLQEYIEALRDLDFIGIVEFTFEDIVRNGIIGIILSRLEQYRKDN